jgi:hypothetical protein
MLRSVVRDWRVFSYDDSERSVCDMFQGNIPEAGKLHETSVETAGVSAEI